MKQCEKVQKERTMQMMIKQEEALSKRISFPTNFSLENGMSFVIVAKIQSLMVSLAIRDAFVIDSHDLRI